MPTFSKCIPTFWWHLSKRLGQFSANIIAAARRCKQLLKKNGWRRAKRAATERSGPGRWERSASGEGRKRNAASEASRPGAKRPWPQGRSASGEGREPSEEAVSSVLLASRRLRAWRRSDLGGDGRRGGTRPPPRDGRGRREARCSGHCQRIGVANFTPYYLTG